MDDSFDGPQGGDQNPDDEDYAAEYRTTEHFPIKLRSIARFGVDRSGTMREVSVPQELQEHRYIKPILEYINSPETTFEPASVERYRAAFTEILNVASTHSKHSWAHFGPALLKSLVDSNTAETQLKKRIDAARRLLVCAEDFSNDRILKRELREITGATVGGRIPASNSSWPNLRAVPGRPQRSLECEFKDKLEYTNKQYIQAVTEYASAFILAWADIRRELREKHPDLLARIEGVVNNVGVSELGKIEARRRCPTDGDLRSQWMKSFSLGMEALEALDCPLLNWSAITNHAPCIHLERLVEAADLPNRGAAGYTQMFRDKMGDLKFSCQYRVNGGRWRNTVAKLPFSPVDLLRPTLEEEICFIWILSTQRIQLSNIQRLTRGNIDWVKKSITIRSYKGRNNTAETTSFLRNTKHGRAVGKYIEEFDRYSGGWDGERLVVNRCNTSSQFRFVGTPNFSHLTVPEEVEGLGAYGVSSHSTRVMKDLYAIITENNRRIDAAHRSKQEAPSIRSMAPTRITQSSVYADEAGRPSFRLSPNMATTYEREDVLEDELRARGQFHSLETRRDVYIARSEDRIKVAKGSAFSAQVSEEMTKMANKIIAAWEEKTSCLSVGELVALIGLRGISPDTPPETLLAAAKAENFVVEKSGLIRKNGKTYLFDNGLTARMMMEEQCHIEGELEKLFSTQDRDRAINAWAKYIFLDLLLKKLSRKSRHSALREYGHLEGKIPHAPISEGGNSWIVE